MPNDLPDTTTRDSLEWLDMMVRYHPSNSDLQPMFRQLQWEVREMRAVLRDADAGRQGWRERARVMVAMWPERKL